MLFSMHIWIMEAHPRARTQRTLKGGLTRLRQEGLCKNAGYAYWTFGGSTPNAATDALDSHGAQRQGYEHQGLPLIPSIAAELALELFAGKTEKRSVVADAVLRAHLDRGGAPPNAHNVHLTLKKGLDRLRREGLCKSAGYAYWTFGGSLPLPNQAAADIDAPYADTPTDVSPGTPDAEQPPLSADTVSVGQGDGSVYVYYLPVYAKMATSEGRKTWPCKIGRTDGDAMLRVMSQASTALPEAPEIALVFKTKQPVALEVALHSILKLGGRWRKDSPGSEWFDTCPDEVLSLYRLIEGAVGDQTIPQPKAL